MIPGPVAIIADDLTGALDTASQFRTYGGAVTLLALEHWPGFTAYPVVAATTETRHLPAEEAARRLRQVVRHLRAAYGPALPRLYKKIDSMLRGHPGQEIDALLEELGLECALVAPAYPAQGRITTGGFHLVGRTPVAKSDAGRDPLTPVTESHLVRLLSQQSRYPVGHLPLDVVMAGAPAIRRHLQRLLDGGVRLVAADATTEEHLDALGEAMAAEPRVLPCGSAGLAGSLAGFLSPGSSGGERREPREHEGGAGGRGALALCGSQSRTAFGQVAEVEARGVAEVWRLDPERLIAPGERRKAVAECARAAGGALDAGRNVLIHVSRRPGEGPPAATLPAEALAAAILSALGELGQRLAGHARRLILTGGDTAMAVCLALGVRALAVEGEVLPGVVHARPLGAGVPEVPVVTKAGSFGDPATLVKLLDL